MFRMPIFTLNILVTVDPGVESRSRCGPRFVRAGRRTAPGSPHVYDSANGGFCCGSTCSGYFVTQVYIWRCRSSHRDLDFPVVLP